MAALFLAGSTRPRHLAAQDTTLAALTGAVGVAMQGMSTGQPVSAPGLELTLRRATIAPGGTLPDHCHPGALVLFVEADACSYTALGGTIQPSRAAVGGSPSPAEAVPMGTEIILNPGDWIFVKDAQDDIRSTSSSMAKAVVIALVARILRVPSLSIPLSRAIWPWAATPGGPPHMLLGS